MKRASISILSMFCFLIFLCGGSDLNAQENSVIKTKSFESNLTSSNSISQANADLIVIDGNKDDFYNTLTGPNDGYLQFKNYHGNDNGVAYSNADLSSKLWAAWDNNWFYIYTEVMDDTISGSGANSYQDDGLELKIDPKPTSTANSIFAPNLTILGGAGSDSLNAVADTLKKWVRKIVPGGYVLEFAIKWPAIVSGTETVSVAVDSVFGLAINFHDNDHPVGGTREHSIQWAAALLDNVWNTPGNLGTVKFLPNNKLKFIPTNNFTGVTNLLPYDGTPFYINVDGTKDRIYNALRGPNDGYLQLRSFANSDNGKPVNDADLSAKIWTAWDNKWFYLYEEVRDDTLAANATNVWEEDELELKFDPQPTDSVANSIWDTRLTALGMGTAGVVAADSLNNVADSLKMWKRTKISGGYALELAIKWSVIKSGTETITPAKDNVFGLAINQHDNDGKARRQASIMWAAVLLDAAWNTPKYLGTVKFLADNKLQYVAKNNMTGKTNLIPYDGSNYVGVEDEKNTIPLEYSLSQNYPNPFNPETTIEFSLPSQSNINLIVYDILGRVVKELASGDFAPGKHMVKFNAANLASGIYFYRITAGDFVNVKKLMLLK